jgi:hypothetical protein
MAAGGGIMVLGLVLVFGNATGLRPTFPFAGFLVMTLGGAIVGMGKSSLIRTRAPVGESPRSGDTGGGRSPGPVTPASAPAVHSPATVELPLTPELHRSLEALCSRSWREILVVAAVLLVYSLVVGSLFLREEGPVGLRYTFVPLGLGTGVGVIMLIALTAEYWLLRRDLRGLTFLRTTGPMRTWVFRQYYQLKVADQKFTITPQIAAKVSGLQRGTVSHTRHAHRILEVWDPIDRVVYHVP